MNHYLSKIMLDVALWTSFEQALSTKDVEDIDRRLSFLRDTLEDAVRLYDIEDIKSELDLNLHIYLMYFQTAGNEQLSAWQIHEAWFNYHKDSEDITPELANNLKGIYMRPEADFRDDIASFLDCLDYENLIRVETDAVFWLSFLDYLASRMIYRISVSRMQVIFRKCSAT